MTIRNSSLAIAVLLSQALYITAFSQKPSRVPDEEVPRVFTKPDGTQVTATIDIEKPFDTIAPQNQKIILEWKMNQIVQSSDFDVTYTRKKGETDTGYIKGTDIKVDKDVYYHELTIENGGDIPITGLTVIYAIAYNRRQSAGIGLRNPEDGQGFHAVTLPVMDIAAHEKKVVITPHITLKNYQNLQTTYNNRDEGGGQSAEEYAGVLFRFIRNGVTLRDVANPPGITDRKFNLDTTLDGSKKAR
jgi:hypothetical protein